MQPIFPAIDTIAAHCDSCSARCSNTMRTARSRTSGEYFADFFMAPSSQISEPPQNPGRFNRAQTALLDRIGLRLPERLRVPPGATSM